MIDPHPRQSVAGQRITTGRRTGVAAVARPDGAGPGGRCRDSPPASGVVSHVQHRPQHQLHEHLHGGLRFLRVLPARPGATKATCCRATCCWRRSTRRCSWAAIRSCCRAACIRRSRSSGTKNCCATSSGTFRRSTSTASARRRSITSRRSPSCRCARCSNGCRRPVWGAFPAAARRSWSIACAARSRAAKC